MRATVGKENASMRLNSACTVLIIAAVSTGSVSVLNSEISAPTIKPDGLADPMTSPRGRVRDNSSM